MPEVPLEHRGDADEMLKAIGQRWETIRVAAPTLLADESFMLSSLGLAWETLDFAAAELKDNRVFMLSAVKRDWRTLFSTPGLCLRSDREAMLAAVSQSWLALELAEESLRADRELVSAAVCVDWWALEYAAPEFWSDREIILDAVRQDWHALYYAADALLEDPEVILEGLKQSTEAYEYAAPILKERPDILQTFATSRCNDKCWALDELGKNLFTFAEARVCKFEVAKAQRSDSSSRPASRMCSNSPVDYVWRCDTPSCIGPSSASSWRPLSDKQLSNHTDSVAVLGG